MSRYAVAFLCTATCAGMTYVFHRTFVHKMTTNPIYMEAMDKVKQHKGVISFLGEPITQKQPVLANAGMLISGHSDVQVRVSGPKSHGIVFLKVINKDDQIVVDSIQLQIGKDQSKRLLIKGSESEQPNSESP